jgi:hypothetical protein
VAPSSATAPLRNSRLLTDARVDCFLEVRGLSVE